VASFRPGTAGNQLALGVHWRAAGLLTPVRIELFDRTVNRVVKSWEVPFDALWEVRRERRDGVRGMAFAPHGRWLAVGTRSGGVYVIDTEDPVGKPRHLVQEREAVKHLFPTADGNALLTLSLDGHLRRWRADDWKQETNVKLPTSYPNAWEPTAGVVPLTGDLWVSAPQGTIGQAQQTYVLRFTPQLHQLDSHLYPRLVRLPAPHPVAPVVMVSADGEQPVTSECLALGVLQPHGFSAKLDRFQQRSGFTSDGQLFYTGTDSPLIKFWDTAQLTQIGQMKFAGGNGFVAAAPDAPRLAITAEDRVHLYESSTDGPQKRIGFDAGELDALGLSADGSTVVTSSAEGLFSWRTSDGHFLGLRADFYKKYLPTTPRVLPAIGLDTFGITVRDGAWVVGNNRPPGLVRRAEGDDHCQVDPLGRVWAWRNQNLIVGDKVWQRPIARMEAKPVTAVAVDGERAVLPLTDGLAVLFNLRSGGLRDERVWRWGGPTWTVAALLPSGPLVVGDINGRIRVIDPTDGHERIATDVHTKAVVAVVSLGDGWILSGGQDGRLAVCRLLDETLRVEAVIPFERPVTGVAIAADGVTVAVLCEGEHQVRVWRLDRMNAAWGTLGVGLDLPTPLRVLPSLPMPRVVPADARGPGLWREVYSDSAWSLRVDGRVDGTLNHKWQNSGPLPAIRDGFSIEWRGHLTPPAAGRYRFRVDANNRVALFLGDRPVASKTDTPEQHASPSNCEADLPVEGVPIRVEYADFGGGGWLKVEWCKPGPNGSWTEIDPKYLSPHPPKS
jgi:WD40 repeat protein